MVCKAMFYMAAMELDTHIQMDFDQARLSGGAELCPLNSFDALVIHD